ncbi:hypothetical protein AB0D04_16405 [Streptomyces sp. NPDC048483]|uniref:hypothetical protein n=1 Tax=Streptomyces sp. NPDC048483 TaxID=3154927 RepID=UPI003429DC70
MGSLRNPIGPLPSSIYWRRRAVALAIVALLALVVVWVLSMGGDTEETGGKGGKGTAHGPGPATSITPGPSGSGPAISQKPGGRGGSGGESGSGGSGGASGADDGDNGASGSGGSGGGPIGQGSGGRPVPVDSPLLNCTTDGAELTLRSIKHTYKPGEKPQFELTVKNSAGSACKVDLGRKAAVLTIKDSAGDDRVWASNDCPAGTSPALLKVPAKGSVERTVEWDRRASAPQCATPSAAAVPAGKYVVEAKVPGLDPVEAKFELAKG